METILITGGAGFIGSNCISALLAQGVSRVVCVDNFDPVYEPHYKEAHIAPFLSHSQFVLYRVDIRDQNALREVFERERPTRIIHLAARADTRKAVLAPHEYVTVNVSGTLNVLECAREYGVLMTVLASSSSVYGNNPDTPWSEESDTDHPLSPYGATKKATELLAHSYHHNFGMQIVCLRFFNVYGENNRPEMVPYIWAEEFTKQDGSIEISGDGSRKRDYTYVGDIVRGVISAVYADLGYEIINLGHGSPLSLRELLGLFETVCEKKLPVRTRTSHAASAEITYADTAKAERLLAWKPDVTHEEGIRRLVAWFRTHRM